jgi:transcriptional regulator with XRE-family HTH domain
VVEGYYADPVDHHPSPDDGATFADLLTRHRLAANLSRERLAAVSSLSVRAVGDLERGVTRRPQRASVVALADALRLSGAARNAFLRAARLTPPTQNQRTGAPPSALIGRGADIDGVAGRLLQPMTRLLTVTGPTGVGKSAVAANAVWRVADRFADIGGLDLAEVGAPSGFGPAIVAAVGSGRAGTGTPTGHLVLLDGFRHGDAAALFLADLLRRHRALRVLVTALAPLKLRGEHVWPLAPLPPTAAATMLAERVCAVRSGFRPEPGDEEVIASLSRRVAGVPRAIELAALRLRTRDLDELDAELASELGADGSTDPAEVVHRMVAAAIARLPARESLTLAALATASGGMNPADLRRRLAVDMGVEHVEMAVAALVSLGLVTVDDRSGRARLRTVDPVADIVR